ncbi:hypothetical protein niasHS_005572 [Heterodera schachtii]|uniref:Uncharacterized protein n=1 Tax=Heterodera schachtii TaxID=97005 RepID=A0ABD2JZI1_HETSC
MPPEIFNRFKAIYMDKTLAKTKRLELLDEMFMALPDDLLSRFPVPAAFRKLPPAQQKRVHRIYYGKRIGFDGKMRELGRLINQLSIDQQRRLMPIRPVEEEQKPKKHMPTLVEFEVPVLLQFSGHLETHLLKAYLDSKNFEFLEWLIGTKGIDEASRARLVGVFLKQSYQLDPDNFPLPLNGDSHEIEDDIRNLGVRLMFGKSPFDRTDIFKVKLDKLKQSFSKRTQEKEDKQTKATNEAALDCVDEAENAWIDRLEMFPEAKLFQFRHNDNSALTAQKSGSLFGNLEKFFAAINGTVHMDWNSNDFAA